MPIQRNQPSPERQSVLSFVSPSVADLLFFETVDAKTVGAGAGGILGKGASILSATWSYDVDINVDAGDHQKGYTVTITTDNHHYLNNGDYVTVEGLGRDSGYFSANGTHKIANASGNSFTYFVREQPDAASPIDVTNNPRIYLAHPSYGTAHPDTEKFPRHKLCHVKQADPNGLTFQYYYAADRLHQDDYNFEFSQADFGGNKYDTVVRTYVTLRSDFSDTDDKYKAGDPMPDVPASQFVDEYILMTRQQKRIGDAELDGLFVVEQRIYFKRVSVSTASYDETTEGTLIQTETLYHRGEVYNSSEAEAVIEREILDETKWGVSAEGVRTEGKQLSDDWFLVTSTDVIPQDKTSDYSKFGGKLLRYYDTYITYSWPAVLGEDGTTDVNGALINQGIHIMTWKDKGGGNRDYVRPQFKEHGYRGPTRATITEEWSLQAPSIVNDNQRPFTMKPLPIVYNSPYLSVQIPPTLHPSVFVVCDTGTSDPTWGHNTGSKVTYPETNVTDWPDSFVATVEVNPFRGGYLTRQVTVFKPEPIDS